MKAGQVNMALTNHSTLGGGAETGGSMEPIGQQA